MAYDNLMKKITNRIRFPFSYSFVQYSCLGQFAELLSTYNKDASNRGTLPISLKLNKLLYGDFYCFLT